MTLPEEYRPCLHCGSLCDGDLCSDFCERSMALRKPTRGATILRARARSRDRAARERRAMTAAKKRDGYKCQYPGCTYRDLPLDACHSWHRGIGGNPLGDRTKRELLLTLCRVHHGQWDRNDIDFMPTTSAGFDGPVQFIERTSL